MSLLRDFPFPVLISAVLCLVMFIYSFRLRRLPEGIFLIVLMAFLCLQGVFSMGELGANGLEQKLFWRNMQQIPLYTAPVLFLGIIMITVGASRKTLVRSIGSLIGVMLVYWILLFTDTQHHWIRESVWLEPFGEFERIMVEPTDFGYMFIWLNQIVGLWGIGLLLMNYKKMYGRNKKQFVLLILATLCPYFLPWVASLFQAELNVAISLIPTAVLIFTAVHRYKFLQVRPIAREKVLEHMSEGILIADEQNRILDANPAAVQMLGGWICSRSESGNPVGKRFGDLFGEKPELMALCGAEKTGKTEAEFGGKHVEARYIPIHVRGMHTGSLLILTDITERKTYEGELFRQATVDGLTELNNRSRFFELLEETFRQHAASRESRETFESRKSRETIGSRATPKTPAASLALIDLDHFKEINDRYGHVAGDRVLRHFASLARKVVGDRGVLGRIGGEEFAVFFPALDGESAYRIAEEMRLTVAGEKLSLPELGQTVEIAYSVSIGVAELLDSHPDVEAWYQQADESMYVSKQNGRNRTTLARPL